MMFWVVGITAHLFFMFFAVALSKMAENEDVIDDADLPIILSFFVPVGVLVVIGGLWVADLHEYSGKLR